MQKILKNTTASAVDVIDTGARVPASGQYEIPPQDYLLWHASEDIVTLIGAGTIVVNNGTEDLSDELGISLLQEGIAQNIRFDNGVNGFPAGANNVQAAIESILAFSPEDTTSALFDDFDGRMAWSPSTSGVGASASASGGNAEFASGKHIGVARIAYGTGAGSAALALSGALSNNAVFGNGVGEYQTLIRIPTLATTTEDYVFRCGYGTSTTADHADGIYFEYDRAQSANWRLKTASNSTRTVVTSSIAVAAGAWIKLRWVCNEDGTSVSFYINDVLAGSITTNIPTVTGRGCGPNYQIVSVTILSGQRSVVIDYFYSIKYFTARN